MENALLLDTNAVSLLLKEAETHEDRKQRLNGILRGKIAFISFVTVAELLFWAEKYRWGGRKRDALDARLRAFGILDPTRDTAGIWARLRFECEAAGKSVGQHDLWIGAAAIEHDLPVVSADSDFDNMQLTRLDF